MAFDWNSVWRTFRNDIRDPYLDAQTGGLWSHRKEILGGVFTTPGLPERSGQQAQLLAAPIAAEGGLILLALAALYALSDGFKFGSTYIKHRSRGGTRPRAKSKRRKLKRKR